MTEPTHRDGQLGHDFVAPKPDDPLWFDEAFTAAPPPRRKKPAPPITAEHRGQLRI